MSSLVRQRQCLMFRARSYMAFVLTPQPPLADWLSDLDASLARSRSFFAGYPVALDLAAVPVGAAEIAELVEALTQRGMRVLGVEGVAAGIDQAGLPPILRAGRSAQESDLPEPAVPEIGAAEERRQPASLLIESPVRSGQSVIFLDGDITVLGSVGSGAEIVAGGSIHIYGALRGRAMAGASGNVRARIFCHRVEAELLAISSYYKTAEDIDDGLRRQPAQAFLDGRTLKISAMN